MPDNPPIPNQTGQRIREGISAVIGIAILAITSYMLIDTYTCGKKPFTAGTEAETKARTDAYARQKDLLLYAIALLGTVTGYYFGRVPAELHAQSAQSNAQRADERANKAAANEADTKNKVKAGLVDLKKKLPAAEAGGGRPEDAREIVQAIDSLLIEIS